MINRINFIENNEIINNRKIKKVCFKIPKGDSNEIHNLTNFSFYEKNKDIILFPIKYSTPEHLRDLISIYYQQSKHQKKKIADPNRLLTPIEDQYLNWMKKFWTLKNLIKLSYIHLKQTPVNFSLLDWLCTNYSKEFPNKCIVKNNNNEDINIHVFYLLTEKSYMKNYFDPFARGVKIIIEFEDIDNDIFSKVKEMQDKNTSLNGITWDHDKSFGLRWINEKRMVYLGTSINQLTFMMWAFQFGIFEYCETNIIEISHNMKKQTKISGKRKRRNKNMPSRCISTIIKKTNINSIFDNLDDIDTYNNIIVNNCIQKNDKISYTPEIF